MTDRAFYGKTLDAITNVVATFDNSSVITDLYEAGIAIEEIALTDNEGQEYIGFIEFDQDGHPKFRPVD